jgi:hypothetical protein
MESGGSQRPPPQDPVSYRKNHFSFRPRGRKTSRNGTPVNG